MKEKNESNKYSKQLYDNKNNDELTSFHLRDLEFDDYINEKDDVLQRERVALHLRECDYCREKMEMLTSQFEEDSIDYLPELGEKIMKILDLVPVHFSVTHKKHIPIGKIQWQKLALSFEAKSSTSWVDEKIISPSNFEFDFSSIEDDKNNLICRISIPESFVGDNKKLCLEGEFISKKVTLSKSGTRWFCEVVIPVEVRKKIKDGGDISLELAE